MDSRRPKPELFGIDGGDEESTNARRAPVEPERMRQHRYIIASSDVRGSFLLIRANSSDDGTLIASGSRAEMVALRGEFLSAESGLEAPAERRLRAVAD